MAAPSIQNGRFSAWDDFSSWAPGRQLPKWCRWKAVARSSSFLRLATHWGDVKVTWKISLKQISGGHIPFDPHKNGRFYMVLYAPITLSLDFSLVAPASHIFPWPPGGESPEAFSSPPPGRGSGRGCGTCASTPGSQGGATGLGGESQLVRTRQASRPKSL